MAGTITLVALGFTNAFWIYILYVLSAVCLTYMVYLVVKHSGDIKSMVIRSLQKHRITRQMLEDYGYRSVIMAILSFIFNILYAAFHAVMAILSRSIWLGALAVYYIVICGIRGVLLKKKKVTDISSNLETLELYRNTGICLMVLNFALIPSLVQIVIDNQGFEYAGLMIYVMATYTFYKLIVSIFNLFRARKLKDDIIQAIKNIGFADALVSILALQTALLSAFGGEDINMTIPNALTGGFVSMTIIAIGIIMIIRGQKKINTIKKESLEECENIEKQ